MSVDTFNCGCGGMSFDHDGDGVYVTHADYGRLEAELAISKRNEDRLVLLSDKALARIAELEKQVESMKCCDNCALFENCRNGLYTGCYENSYWRMKEAR